MDQSFCVRGGSGSTVCRSTALGFLALGWITSPAFAQTRVAVEHHLHIRTQAAAEVSSGFAGSTERKRAIGAMEALGALDAASIERGLVISVAYMFGSPMVEVEDEYVKVRAENDYVARQVASAPDRLVGACSVNPLAEYALREIERCAGDLNAAALKLHFANSEVDLLQEAHVDRLANVFRMLERLDLPAIVHLRADTGAYNEEVRVFVGDILSQAPGIDVQIAHMTGWGGYDRDTDTALGIFADAMAGGRLDPARITFDLGAVVFNPEAAGADTALARTVREANEQLVVRIRQIGTDRVVYATDWPSWPPVRDIRVGMQRNVRLIEQALPLTPSELDAIFGNANAIVRRRQGR